MHNALALVLQFLKSALCIQQCTCFQRQECSHRYSHMKAISDRGGGANLRNLTPGGLVQNCENKETGGGVYPHIPP